MAAHTTMAGLGSLNRDNAICNVYLFFYLKFLKKFFYLFTIVTEREREAETQAEGEAGSTHQEPYVGFDPGSPGSRPRPKAGAKPLCHPGIPCNV